MTHSHMLIDPSLTEAYKEIKNATFWVKATPMECQVLSQRYSSDAYPHFVSEFYKKVPKVNWKQNNATRDLHIGNISYNENLPVTINVVCDKINDKFVCFYHASGTYMDEKMFESWLQHYFGFDPAHRDDKICDADNFYRFLHHITGAEQTK